MLCSDWRLAKSHQMNKTSRALVRQWQRFNRTITRVTTNRKNDGQPNSTATFDIFGRSQTMLRWVSLTSTERKLRLALRLQQDKIPH